MPAAVVSPEWAAAVAGISTGHLEAALARPDLWQELALLEKLLYKNTNQHRGARHFRCLQEVRRLLRLLQALQLDRRAAELHGALDAAKQRGSLPSGALLAYGGDLRRLPSHQAAAGVLRALLGACHLVEELSPAVHRATLQLAAQLAHSFFMPLCLTSLAALARAQVLAAQLLLDCVHAYNRLAEAATLLPLDPSSEAAAAEGAAAAAAAGDGGDERQASADDGSLLPQLLRVQWSSGLPLLERVPCEPGQSLDEQAAAASARYGLRLMQPEAAAGPTVLAERTAAPAQQRRRQGQQAPVLAVLEDRGIPISREAFAAAADAPSGSDDGGDAPMAAAAATSGEDEDDAAVAAAAAAAAGPGQPAAAAPPLLPLGVVEDSMLERRLRGGVVEVESLMEGEARGHLYRRTGSALGLGTSHPPTQPAKKQRPGAASGGVPMAAARPDTPAPAAAAAAAAAAKASSGPKPAFLSVAAATQPAAPAAPKPAFLAVGAPAAPKPAPAAAAKPAFLAVGVPAGPKPAAAAAAPAQAAAPLALDATGRKRKKPVAAEQQAAAVAAAATAAAPPKSWEDWLQPLGGAPAAPSAAPAADKQQQQQQGKRRKRGR